MPNNFSEIDKIATIIAILVGVWGAVLNFSRRDVSGAKIVHKISLFLMDVTVNVGLTLLTYIGLLGYGINELIAVSVGGVIGHQGVRSVYLIELAIAEKLGAKKTFDTIKEDGNNVK